MTSFLDVIRVPHLRNGFIVAKMGSEAATLLRWMDSRLSHAAGSTLIATLWQGLALTAFTALCLRLAPRATATFRFALWTAVLLLICVVPLVVMSPANAPLTPIFHVDPRWSLALAALWLAFSFFRAVDLARHALRLRSLVMQATPIDLSPELATLLCTNRNAQLCTSTQLDSPGVIGFLHPRILIPAWLFDRLTAAELEQIVLHELEHLRRGDDWLNLLQKLVLVVFPLNPALFWIERRLCLERELACDEGVVRRTHAPRLYATCLARLAEHGLSRRALSLTLGFLERQSELVHRITGILRAPQSLSPRQNLALTGTMAVLLLGGSVELARCPQLVSFSPAITAANLDLPRFLPETWIPRADTTAVRYTDAAKPRLLAASLKQVRKAHRAKVRRALPPVATQRAAIQTAPAEFLAVDLTDPMPVRPAIAPTLVRYTLVHVEGGWLLVQL